MSRLTGQPWLLIARTIDDGWSRSGRLFWREVGLPDDYGERGREPNRLHDAVVRAMVATGWRICSRRGHLFAGEWGYYIGGDKARRWCVRCLNATQVGVYETEQTPNGRVRVTKVTPI